MSFVVDVDVPVPMRDGVALATNVWRPAAPGPFPALLVRTPYGKDDAGTYGNPKLPDVFAFVEAGYAVVAQDVRGTSRSPGTFVPNTHEGDDGVDTLAWLAGQPWCDGAVGMWGGSYMGFTQWQAAVRGAPALRAIAPVMSSADPYGAPWYSPGGALSQDAVLTWGTLAALRNLRRGLADGHGDGDPADADVLLSGLSEPRLLHDPLPLADRGALTRHLPWVGEVLDHPERDAFWQDVAAIDRCAGITVPALQVGGWYDVFVGETVRSYTMMRRHGGSAEARDGQRLLIGPWCHADGADLGTFPDRSFGLEGSIKAADITGAHLRFFDRWVRGRTDTPDDPHRVRIFVMGVDRWRDEVDWPLPDTRCTDFFLAGGGRANSATGDGVLTRDAGSEAATDTFRYDPRHPVPTLGGTVLAAVPGAYPGPADQAPVEAREDVLCFTTAVLDRPVEVTGHVTLVLHVSSSAPDTDFTGKLVDVHPDGRAILLCEGIQRARYRESLTDPTPLEPGTVHELTVDLGVTSNVFLPGHRIRLEVSSSNFPRYDRNTNTGRTIATDGEDNLAVAVNRVHHGPGSPSRLVLPLIDRPEVESAVSVWHLPANSGTVTSGERDANQPQVRDRTELSVGNRADTVNPGEAERDRMAVADVVAGLAHAQDDRDWAALRRLFADDVLLDLSTHHIGRPPTSMPAADLVELARRTLTGFDCTHHAASNLVVRLAGDEAECRTHMVAYHHVPAEPGVVDHCTMRGYWRLRLRRVDRRWLITDWAVVRTAPWEGSPDVYALAATRGEPRS